jgi:16S rRNA U516 pseudouridylate synthase RsuA-like enzyme
MPEERLQKILSRAGIASRRKAEQIIQEGRVTVNGTAISIATISRWMGNCCISPST